MALTPTLADPGADPDDEVTSGWSVGRVLGVVAALAMVLFWIWILAGGPDRKNPDYLDDRAFAKRTQQRCAAMLRQLDRLPAAADSKTPDERADVIVEATDEIRAMVDDIEADAPKTGDDHTRITGWLKEYRVWLDDRDDYARRLRQDARAQFLIDTNPAGDSVDRSVTNFADINNIPECDTPGDVG